MYLSDHRVYFKVEVYFRVLKQEGGVLESQKKLVDYANTTNVEFIVDLASVVKKADSAIHQINRYPVDSAIGFPNTNLLDRNLSDGQRYPAFEQLGPEGFIPWLINLQLFAYI